MTKQAPPEQADSEQTTPEQALSDSANRGQAFARFETQFQFGWVVAAVLPVVLPMPGRAGYLMVGAVTVAALVSYATGVRTDQTIANRVNRR